MARGPTVEGLTLTDQIDDLVYKIGEMWKTEPDSTVRADFIKAAQSLEDARYHLLEATNQLEMGS